MDYRITPFYDITEYNPFKYFLVFIRVIVEPLLNCWTEFLPPICKQTIVKGLTENKKLIN